MKSDNQSDLYLSQIARATIANMHYTRVLALVVMFFIFQAFIAFVTWGAFALADDYIGPPTAVLLLIGAVWLAGILSIGFLIGSAMNSARESRGSL